MHKINKLFFVISFILLISFNCKSQPSAFNFSGRLLLYSCKMGLNYELFLLNVDKKQELKLPQFEIPYRAFLYGWSNDRKYLLFYSGGPRIFEFPSFNTQSIGYDYEDSLKIYRNMRFIGNNEIIFAASKNDDNFDNTNIYELDFNTKTINQITNTNSLKEIKSTFYSPESLK